MSSGSNNDALGALAYLATHPESTTSDVGKAVFDPDETDDLRNADRKVRHYFESKFDHLVTKVDSQPATYSVEGDKVYVGVGRVEMRTFDDSEISVGLGVTVMYPDEDGNQHIDILGGDYELDS